LNFILFAGLVAPEECNRTRFQPFSGTSKKKGGGGGGGPGPGGVADPAPAGGIFSTCFVEHFFNLQYYNHLQLVMKCFLESTQSQP
jgi:hypothetical protein